MSKSLPDRAIEWRDQQLILLDQRRLPTSVSFMHIESVSDVVNAIKDMVVRGAPAIGITAAYGVVLSAIFNQRLVHAEAVTAIGRDLDALAQARPTAVNLRWALQRMRACLLANKLDWVKKLEQEAVTLHREDIARLGAEFLSQQCQVITHCNAGALATGGYGTALGVIRAAFAEDKLEQVFACETRPWFQGARLTAWELAQERIPVELVCDSAAASVLSHYPIEWVIVGADRVAANGDVANKIGTLALAILARYHGKKFMVVAPTSTLDLETPDGSAIEIEIRNSDEITRVADQSMTADSVAAWNPVFDITPADLVDVLVTEKGVIERPDRSKIARLLSDD